MTVAIENLFPLISTGDSTYDCSMCVHLLKEALSANCMGHTEKFEWLLSLIVELRLSNTQENLAQKLSWTRPEIILGEFAYYAYKNAVFEKLLDMLALDEESDIQHMRAKIHTITLYLWELPQSAHDTIRLIVAAAKAENDIQRQRK